MALTKDNVKALLCFVGPIFVPKLLSYYRQMRRAPRVQGLDVRPLPVSAARAILLLAVVSVFLLLKMVGEPENIFLLTHSRLQTPTDVLFTRLAHVRQSTHGSGLTTADEVLKSLFTKMDARLLYLQHGPEPLIDCFYCSFARPLDFTLYALPGTVLLHVVNTCMLGLATSTLVAGVHGRPWRRYATWTALVLAVVDVYATSTYDAAAANARTTRLGDIDFFFWRMRTLRYAALVLVNVGLMLLVFLSSTNRAFGQFPLAAVDRIQRAQAGVTAARGRINTTSIAHGAVLRDATLREHVTDYWRYDAEVSTAAMDHPDVRAAVQDALTSKRLNMSRLTQGAEEVAHDVVAEAR